MTKRNGFSLLEVTLVAALLAMVGLGVMSTLNSLFHRQQSLVKHNDIEAIRADILQSIDCGATFAPIAATLATNCNSANVNRLPLVLMRIKNAAGVNLPVTQNGTLLSSGNFKGSTTYTTTMYLKAFCDQASGSLLVTAAKGDGTNFMKDPTTNSDFDFNIAPNPLFGGSTAPKLCAANVLGSATLVTCSTPGMVMNGMDFGTSPPTPNCVWPTGSLTVSGGCSSGQFVDSIAVSGTTITPHCSTPSGGTTTTTGGGGGSVSVAPACAAGQYVKNITASGTALTLDCESFGSLFKVYSASAAVPNTMISCGANEFAISGGGRCPLGSSAGVRPRPSGGGYISAGSLSSSGSAAWEFNCNVGTDVTGVSDSVICLNTNQ